jgi:hypothetical protein
MKPLLPLVLALSLATASSSQEPLAAKSFLPDDHRNVIVADLAAMRAKGIWDEMEASALKVLLAQLQKETGMAVRAIDRIVMVADPGAARPGERRRGDVQQVLVIEGNAPLGMSEAAKRFGEEVTIGGHATRSRMGELSLNPRPEVYVAGTESLVRPVLEGKPYRGTPSADVMSLLAGREGPLAYFVMDVTTPMLRANLLEPAFPDTTWPDGEGPTFVCVRLLATGDPDDPHLGIEAVVRHAKDGDGVATSQTGLEALRDRLVAMPQLRALKPVLAAMTTKADRGDVVCTLDLGRARDAVGHVAVLAGMLFVTGTEARSVEVEARPAADPAPVPAPAPTPKKQ